MKSARAVLMLCTVAWVFVSLAVSAVATFGQQHNSDGKAIAKRQAGMAAALKFAETVLEHGRDTYGEKQTPLLVDALNVDTMKPPARLPSWSSGEGMQPWVSSNLADQGNLMRFLVGLSNLTGEPKYKRAAISAVKYNFDHFQGPGGIRALDQAEQHRVGACLKNRYGITAAKYDLPNPPNDRFLPDGIPGCVLWLRAEPPGQR